MGGLAMIGRRRLVVPVLVAIDRANPRIGIRVRTMAMRNDAEKRVQYGKRREEDNVTWNAPEDAMRVVKNSSYSSHHHEVFELSIPARSTSPRP
jgi:hypothetical protein